MVCLLLAGLVTQVVTNAVVRGSGGGMAGIAVAQSTDGIADRFLADLAQSVCSKESGTPVQGTASDCFCQFCFPASYQLVSDQGGQIAAPMRLGPDAGPWSHSQVLAVSRRLPGDGPSRAPPSIA
ncbi:hypothetical protein CU669_20560 [Paramagnetospirillum kuznetsovii]|uniref:DUF2946 domain-containing protein n=1 Tax=Paramagnetospirillum kuznetsovii TaxID=2053833 RepID=A0A364NSL5_9PROT|nr:hypothetical protein CU669_20560 [Paramagnetospirillum kuznetsovii]